MRNQKDEDDIFIKPLATESPSSHQREAGRKGERDEGRWSGEQVRATGKRYDRRGKGEVLVTGKNINRGHYNIDDRKRENDK